MLMVRDVNDFVHQMMGEPVESKKGLKKIQDAGIDTNSKAYQVVISDMTARTGMELCTQIRKQLKIV